MNITGDFNTLISILEEFKGNLSEVVGKKLDEYGDVLLDRMVEHIDRQDLDWVPLEKSTIARKHGNEMIYYESGFLRDNLRALKVSGDEFTIFVGAEGDVVTEKGEYLSDVLFYLEYGSNDGVLPPRPIVRPTWDEMKDLFSDEILNEIIKIL